MKLTSKGRYAVMALVDLARFDNINPVSLRDISLRQGISLDYLEQIFSKLKKNKIVFAGIDLISNYLTGDINITSPTGLKNFKDLTGKDLAVDFWNYLENKLK